MTGFLKKKEEIRAYNKYNHKSQIAITFLYIYAHIPHFYEKNS